MNKTRWNVIFGLALVVCLQVFWLDETWLWFNNEIVDSVVLCGLLGLPVCIFVVNKDGKAKKKQ
jgi:hypothetical protein